MKRSNKKKGFTLVELIVVIAILTILATVSIVGYVSFLKKAKVSNDNSLVTQINTILQAEEAVSGKNKTLYDALMLVRENGFDVDKLTPTSDGSDILWNQESNRFELVSKDEVKSDAYKWWKIYDEVPAESKYSVYLTGTALTGSVNAKTGVDVGENTGITAVDYVNTSGNKQDVVIRTNGGALKVNAPADTVKHYGWIDNLKVTAVAETDCYHEYGFVIRFSSFGSGKFIAHAGAKFHQTEEEVKSVLSGKDFDLDGALFAQHFFLNGKCIGCDMPDHEHIQGETISNTPATCISEGALVYKCSVCGNSISETIPVIEHTWSAWTMDKSTHSRTCSVCNKSESKEHTWENNACTVCSATYVNATSITIEPKNQSDNITWRPGDSLVFFAKVEPADATGTVEWKMKTASQYFEVDNEGIVTCLSSTSTEKYLILQATITNLDGSVITGEYTMPKTDNFTNVEIYTTNHTAGSKSYPVYHVGDEIILDLSPIIDLGGEFKFISIVQINGSGAEFTSWTFDPATKTAKAKAVSTCTVDTNSPNLTLKFSRNGGAEISLAIKSHPKIQEKFYFDGVEFVLSQGYTSSKLMTVNEKCQVSAPEFAARYGKTIEWSSANANFVSIDSEGNITAVGKGQCAIYGRITLDNGEVYTIKKLIKVS